MKTTSGVRLASFLSVVACAFLAMSPNMNGQPEKKESVRVKIGRNRENLRPMTFTGECNLIRAVIVMGGLSDHEAVLLTRDAKIYVLGGNALQTGGGRVPLKNGDEVSIIPGHDAAESLRHERKPIFMNGAALTELHATAATPSRTPPPHVPQR
jgi:molybdopterin converting factor small subunit